MPTQIHKNLSGLELHGPFHYEQTTDPGAVGAGLYWLNTTAAPYTINKRNTLNTAWIAVGSQGVGTVTSIALSMPSDFVVAGSPVTTSGTLAVTAATQTANTVKAGPSTGAAAAPSYRALVSADLPAAPTVTGEVTASDFKPLGLTGATAASRFVGGTVSGAPITGTFAVGDFVIDQVAKIWVCTGAGAPGTWGQAGGGMGNPMVATQDLVVGGTSGAPARLAIGANGQVLAISGGVISWANNPAGFANPMTQIGDIVVGGSAGTPTRLANGANAQVLTIIAGQPGWANPAGGAGGTTNNVATALYLAHACI